MTLLGKQDGCGGDTGVSYLDLAEFLMRQGARVEKIMAITIVISINFPPAEYVLSRSRYSFS